MKKKRTIKALAGKLRVSRTTIYNWLKRPGITRAALWRMVRQNAKEEARQREESAARLRGMWRAQWRRQSIDTNTGS